MRDLVLSSPLFFVLLLSCNKGTTCQWIRRGYPGCPSEPETQYDALGRRQSGYLVPPGNQGSCGSCWAFAASHTFADQININSNSPATRFSPDHLARCSPFSTEGNGCCGGSIYASALFLHQTGAFSESCFPYTLQDYSIPENIEKIDEERIQFKSDNPLTCPISCTNGDSVPIPKKLANYNGYGNSASEIITALQNGPVYMVMSVGIPSHELSQYDCGVFTDPEPYVSSELLPYHAIEIVDYSSMSYRGTPFYVVKNSWDSSWGEMGYFRIVQNSRLIVESYSFTIGTSANFQVESARNTLSTCRPTTVNITKNSLVVDSAAFAIEQLNRMRLLTCLAGSGVPMVQNSSVINATKQVVAGMITEVVLQVTVTGCEEDFAILKVVILQNMNGSFTLLDYSYSTSAALWHTYSWTLLLVVTSLSCGPKLL